MYTPAGFSIYDNDGLPRMTQRRSKEMRRLRVPVTWPVLDSDLTLPWGPAPASPPITCHAKSQTIEATWGFILWLGLIGIFLIFKLAVIKFPVLVPYATECILYETFKAYSSSILVERLCQTKIQRNDVYCTRIHVRCAIHMLPRHAHSHICKRQVFG